MSKEDTLWEQTAYYGYFADRCGWTKEQVQSQPHWYTQRLPGFLALLDEVRAEKSKSSS